MWMQDPVFKPYAHQVGRVSHYDCLCGICFICSAEQRYELTDQLDLTSKSERAQRLRQRYDAIVGEGRGENVEWLDTPRSITDKAPHLKHADLTVSYNKPHLSLHASQVQERETLKGQGWKGLYVKPAGWVAAREALNGVGHELRRLGVKTAFGTSGTFHSLILDDSHGGPSQDVALDRSAAQAAVQKEDTGPRSDQSHPWSYYAVRGVRCVDGTEWYGDIVVIAAGAWTPALIDLEGQCTSKVGVLSALSRCCRSCLKVRLTSRLGLLHMYS